MSPNMYKYMSTLNAIELLHYPFIHLANDEALCVCLCEDPKQTG